MRHAIISSVKPGSLAAEAGILPGDELISINGNVVRDIIDFRFHTADTRVSILLSRQGSQFSIDLEKDYDDPIGVDFTSELFDGLKTCRNRCVFCFVDNLPRGMRRTLYIKDDDYRLSFLHGNFVTLSNVTEVDVQRILEQRLSPLYVSVHATRPDLRQDLLRPRTCPDILLKLRALAQARIQLHTQIVLCPGMNDGERLDETIEDLAGLESSVLSIGIVPVGLTKYTKTRDCRVYSDAEARLVLRQVAKWQHRFRRETGARLVYASDELYLRGGVAVPGSAVYEGYPQYENGIGIVRAFLEELRGVIKRLPESVRRPISVGLITAESAEPFVRQLVDALKTVGNVEAELFAVRNEFFGHTVTVAGLVTGQDIISQLSGKDLPDRLLVPRVMLRDEVFLDDLSVSDVAKALGREIAVVKPGPKGVIQELRTDG